MCPLKHMDVSSHFALRGRVLHRSTEGESCCRKCHLAFASRRNQKL